MVYFKTAFLDTWPIPELGEPWDLPRHSPKGSPLPSDTALLSVTSRPVASGHTHLTTGVSEAGRSALGSLVWVFFCCIFGLDRIRLVREKEVRVYNAVFLAQHSTT